MSLKPYTETLFLPCFAEVPAFSPSPTHCCERCNHKLIMILLSFCWTMWCSMHTRQSTKFGMHVI